MDSNTEISILAIAIDLHPKDRFKHFFGSKSTIQEVVMIYQEFKTIMLTMWENFLENECHSISNSLGRKPIIIGTHLKVKSFNDKTKHITLSHSVIKYNVINIIFLTGFSVSTKPSSSFLIDPHLEKLQDLKSWINSNMQKLNTIIAEKPYLTTALPLSTPPPDKLIELNKIQNMVFMQSTFWAKAKIHVKMFNQAFWYMACDICNKVSNSSYNEVIECIYCKSPQAKAIPRVTTGVVIEDAFGSITTSVVGEPAENLLQCSAKKLMEKTIMDTKLNIHDIIRSSTDKEVILYLKAIKDDHNVVDYKYNIVSIIVLPTVIKEPTNSVQIWGNKVQKVLFPDITQLVDQPPNKLRICKITTPPKCNLDKV
ncbi:hypothetical protein UlMin_010386 [Ulmus minor]